MDTRGVHRLFQGTLRPSSRCSPDLGTDPLFPLRIPHSQLETDQQLLIPKARAALARYGHQVVIGNDLHRRKFEVVLVSPANGEPAQEELDPPLFVESWLRIDLASNPTKEIEEDIIAELVTALGDEDPNTVEAVCGWYIRLSVHCLSKSSDRQSWVFRSSPPSWTTRTRCRMARGPTPLS